ncbi:MAG TPA: sigma-E processing peptidase SpoIIGA [Clostridia bacterium]|nr:sigma-E processing peptidase SpoIIGA [Clostridia bacterium]
MYLDVIFLENLFINYLILSLTKKFSKKNSKSIRLFLGALLGSSYVLLFFLLPYKIIHELFTKLILSFLIIYMAFMPKTLKEFLRILAIFYLISFSLGGTILAILYMTKYNLYNFWIGILIAVLLLYTNWDYIIKKAKEEKTAYNLKVELFEKQAEIKGLLDTGNRLYDPLSKSPVIVIDVSAIKDLIPENLESVIEEKNLDLYKVFEVLKEEKWKSKIRLIPYTSVGQSRGMMLGFKPDKVLIEGKEIKDVIIGVYKSNIDKYGSYEALIGPEVLE